MDALQEIYLAAQQVMAYCMPNQIEIEARIRKSLVNDVSVQRLREDDSIEWDTQFTYEEKRRIAKSNRKCTYRQRTYPNEAQEVICKSSLMKKEINNMWCTVNLSTEMSIPSMSHALESEPTNSVTRQRGLLQGHYVDIIVDNDVPRVEVEACNASAFDPDSMMQVVAHVCTLLQGSPYFVSYYDWKAVTHIIKTKYGKFCIEEVQYQKPKTMTFPSLLQVKHDLETEHENEWVVTPKVDGIRKFVIIFGCKIFSSDVMGNIRYEDDLCGDKELGITILDCEYVYGDGYESDKYHIFDVVVKDDAYYGNTEFHERTTVMDELQQMLPSRFSSKPYKTFDSFDKLESLYLSFMGAYNIDGMIFVDTKKGYFQNVLKWKMYSTVDLEICEDKYGDRYIMACDGCRVNINVAWDKEEYGIWEFRYDMDRDMLVPVRPRPDKITANSLQIIRQNIISAVPGTLFTGIGCYLMRKYHNRVKTQLLIDANDKDAIIVDIGTGQGGDVSKWKRALKVYCVEPSVSSTEEMIERHGNLDNVSIHNVFLRDLDIQKIEGKVRIFTAFFCMNMFQAGDWEVLQKLIKTKGTKNCVLLAIAVTNPEAHNSKCFTITKCTLKSYNMTIHNTRIVNLEEFIVRPATLTKMMKECGLNLVDQQKLNKDNFMTREERLLSSMYTMFVYKKGIVKKVG